VTCVTPQRDRSRDDIKGVCAWRSLACHSNAPVTASSGKVSKTVNFSKNPMSALRPKAHTPQVYLDRRGTPMRLRAIAEQPGPSYQNRGIWAHDCRIGGK
jgi:hypothetical protein